MKQKVKCPKCGHQFKVRMKVGETIADNPPTKQMIEDHARQYGYLMDSTNFILYQTSKGWKVCGKPMKSWKAVVERWCRNSVRWKTGDVQKLVIRDDKGSKINVGYQGTA